MMEGFDMSTAKYIFAWLQKSFWPFLNAPVNYSSSGRN